ncbi:MAG: phosphoribosylformylglycinamidine synthase subunit PurL, partial [Nocardiopsaceae bacterium]|nr:phosphoribosylformylglycinamidine synthase subunit PurL [Nocardiopsaceae bacterium]
AAELALYSVMWSEHCSYKSSKVHLRGLAPSESQSGNLLAGIGANAGVVDIGQGYAVTFKIESHNHPSFVEPHQGAATGVGGIVRDILAMGARPVAVMDALRFGPADAPDTARVLPGVVSGISFYGNCLGLPNVGGELAFDPCYAGNPLVNALCVGVLRHDDLQEASARGAGNKVVIFGSRTGPDGVGGASVLASATFTDEGQSKAKRPSVQVGDPFMEKILIECCLELFAAGLIEGIQDLGAAGVACATTELAAGGDGGMSVNLDHVPLRDPSLTPAEILMSESQERMMAIVRPPSLEAFRCVCAKWDVEATVIGEVTGDGLLTMTWRGGTVVRIPPGTAADGPVYRRPMTRPRDLDALRADRPSALPRPGSGAELKETLLALLGSPELADKRWVTRQYDHLVRGNTVLAAPEDGGLVRVDESTGLGIALATDGNGRYCRLDPYAGTQLALSEAYRNVAMTGARPAAVTNCLNFGSPEDPEVMWQLAESVRGLADGCQALGIPVTGGNVSLYNQTGASPIHPTPVIGVLGVHPDVRRRTGAGFGTDGARVVLLGTTREEFGGSAWARVVHGHLGGQPPTVDFSSERTMATVVASAASSGLIASAHDLSDGGLAVALAESCLRGQRGCEISLSEVAADDFTALFSESAARALVSVTEGREDEFAALCSSHGLPMHVLGVTGGSSLTVTGSFSVPLDALRQTWEAPLPALFN